MSATDTLKGRSSMMTRRECLERLPLPVLAAAVGGDLLRGRGLEAQTTKLLKGADDLGARIYNIRNFGAKGDGTTLDTAALQAAIYACNTDGGGIVLVPSGRFLIGSTELRSNVTLHLVASAKLLGVADGSQYPPVDAVPLEGDATLRDGNRALLYAVGATNIAIEGAGTIDGQGEHFYPAVPGLAPPSKPGDLRRPYHVMLYQCERFTLRDVALVNCAYHSLRIIQSRRIHIDNIYMYNRTNVNNDGFHFISAEHVTVSNSVIYVQDDACAMFGNCKNITVSNCFFSTRWSVFRFGGGVALDIAISNCVLKQVYGCPIKFQANRGARFENISFANLLLDDVTGPIHIAVGTDSDRPVNPGLTPEVHTAPNTPSTARNISFTNISGTVTTDPGQIPDTPPASNPGRPGERFSCITLNAVGDAVLENISFDNIRLTFGGGGTAEMAARRDLPNVAGEYFTLGAMPAYGFYARNSRAITLNNVRFQLVTPDLRPALVFDNVQDASILGLSVEGDPAGESVLRLINSSDVLLTASRLLSPAATYLQVEGGESRNLKVDGGDLSRATVPLILKNGAKMGTVQIRN